MAFRRLAAEQPEQFVFTPENKAWCESQIAKYPPGRQASAVLPLLWRAQMQHNHWLPKAAIELVADMLAMPDIRVLEIATFYSMFNLAPVGGHFIQLCGTTPCVLRGAHSVREVLQRRIGEPLQVTPDGKFSWTEVECLGACCNAPMAQINTDYYEDLNAERMETMLDDFAAGKSVKAGSQTGRVSSEFSPGKATTLNDPTLYDGSVVGTWKLRFEDGQSEARMQRPPEPAHKPESSATAAAGPTGAARSSENPPAAMPASQSSSIGALTGSGATTGPSGQAAQAVSAAAFAPTPADAQTSLDVPSSAREQPAPALSSPAAGAETGAVVSTSAREQLSQRAALAGGAATASSTPAPAATSSDQRPPPASREPDGDPVASSTGEPGPIPGADTAATETSRNMNGPTVASDSDAAAGIAAAKLPLSPAETAAREEAEIKAKLAELSRSATPEEKAHAVGTRPAGLAAARDEGADDLKRIKGIGKVNEGKLNDLGIFHFDQIAAWSREEIRWVGTYLSFPGRIDREDWVAQAKVLSGREAEFSRRAEQGELPASNDAPMGHNKG